MSFPCAPPAPYIAGVTVVPPVIPPPLSLPMLDIGNIVIEEPPAPDPPVPVPSEILPRFASDFPLVDPWVRLWLAMLARASYSGSDGIVRSVAYLACGDDATVTFVPNDNTLNPGYIIIRLARGAVAVVSGTTNLGQWLEQIFSNTLVPLNKLTHPGYRAGRTMLAYQTAAQRVWAALAAVPNNDQVLWAGHSMGGAVAGLLHAAQGQPDLNGRVPSRCCTFAAPKAGDAALNNLMRTGSQVFARFIIADDVVPQLPPDLALPLMPGVPAALAAAAANWSLFAQPGGNLSVQANGVAQFESLALLPLLIARCLLAAAANQPVPIFDAHSLRAYTARFWRAAILAPFPNNFRTNSQAFALTLNALTETDL